MDNLLAGKVGTKDGHGGRAEEHRAEMEEIARKVFEIERAKWMKCQRGCAPRSMKRIIKRCRTLCAFLNTIFIALLKSA